MPEGDTVQETALEAKSPYELRVNLGKNVPESDVRTALATGDMGFLHSFTTGSTVDGPGVEDEGTETITGSSTEATLELDTPGTYTFYCSVGNHRAAGMEGTLTVG